MKSRFATFSFIAGILLSLAGWFNYGRFVYLTSIEPDYLSIEQYNEKYYSQYPGWLQGIHEVNLASVIILALAILLMIFVINYGKKALRTTAYVLLVVDAVVLMMIAMAYA